MRINNFKKVDRLIFIIVVFLIIETGLCFYSLLFFSSVMFEILTGILILSEVIFYFQLRYVEFDDTGEVLILKSYHPLDSNVFLKHINGIEIPKNCIEKYVLKQEKLFVWGNHMGKNKPFKIEFNLYYFDRLSKSKIDQSLKQYLQEHE